MIWIANALVALVAALHVYFLVLEMFLWTKPLGLKTFGNSLEKANNSAVLCGQPGACITVFSPPGWCGGWSRAFRPLHSKSKYSFCSA